RVSLESGRDTTSSWAGSPTKRSLQQPVPAMVGVVVSLMQWPWGALVPGAEPEPGCCCFGGTPYWLTPRTFTPSPTAAGSEFSADVLVRDQRMILLELRVPAAPETGICASSAAFELSRYSVPPLPVANWLVPGDCAGHRVKPGCVAPASLDSGTRPDVSMWTPLTFAAPAASCAFEKA